MHPVSPARVTMMENNNLLLYKLLCKDKVGGVGRGITVGKGRKESGMREPRWWWWWGQMGDQWGQML